MRIDDDIPHIQAACRNCAFIYDLRYGTTCPKCHDIHVSWARLITQKEYKEVMHPNLRMHDGQTINRLSDMVERQMRKELGEYADEQLDIRELDKMYKLEDTREKQ
jgi:hypothetical protein